MLAVPAGASDDVPCRSPAGAGLRVKGTYGPGGNAGFVNPAGAFGAIHADRQQVGAVAVYQADGDTIAALLLPGGLEARRKRAHPPDAGAVEVGFVHVANLAQRQLHLLVLG